MGYKILVSKFLWKFQFHGGYSKLRQSRANRTNILVCIAIYFIEYEFGLIL